MSEAAEGVGSRWLAAVDATSTRGRLSRSRWLLASAALTRSASTCAAAPSRRFVTLGAYVTHTFTRARIRSPYVRSLDRNARSLGRRGGSRRARADCGSSGAGRTPPRAPVKISAGAPAARGRPAARALGRARARGRGGPPPGARARPRGRPGGRGGEARRGRRAPKADINGLNLAARVEDGQQVVVPCATGPAAAGRRPAAGAKVSLGDRHAGAARRAGRHRSDPGAAHRGVPRPARRILLARRAGRGGRDRREAARRRCERPFSREPTMVIARPSLARGDGRPGPRPCAPRRRAGFRGRGGRCDCRAARWRSLGAPRLGALRRAAGARRRPGGHLRLAALDAPAGRVRDGAP